MSAGPSDGAALDHRAVERRAGEVDARLAELELLPDATARDKAVRAVRALLELYGEGLDRVMSTVYAVDPALPARLAADPFISHLLLMHDLHPVPVEERVLAALDEVRPYLESHGGNVELLRIEGGVVHLRMQGSCKGCPSSAMTLKDAIEDAIRKAAPDVLAVEADQPQSHEEPALVTLTAMPTAAVG